MKVQAKAVVAPEDDEIISGDDKNDLEGSNESNGSKDKDKSGNEKHKCAETGERIKLSHLAVDFGGLNVCGFVFYYKKGIESIID